MNFRKAIKRKIELSQTAFQMYLSSRTFASAVVLREINLDACKHVMHHTGEFDDEEWVAISQLVVHWNGWLQQFEFEQKARLPKLDDEFIFERVEGLTAWPKQINEVISGW